MSEKWREIGDTDWWVSSMGRVSDDRGVVRKPWLRNGYPTVEVAGRKRYVHRLVAEAFFGPCLGGTVNHKDFDRTNNRVENLEWLSRADNLRHAAGAGRLSVPKCKGLGSAHHAAKLNEAQVRVIKRRIGKETDYSIAKEYGVDPAAIRHIRAGRNWRHV